MNKFNHYTVWEKCIESIRTLVSEQSFKTWFEPIKPVDLKDFVLTISVPSQYYYEYLEGNFLDELRKVIHEQLGPLGKLKYQVLMDKGASNRSPFTLLMNSTNASGAKLEDTLEDDNVSNSSTYSEQKQQYHDIPLNRNYSFDSYIEGECNRFARSVGIAVANNPGNTSFNPLFVFGSTGLGKTHLVQAIGNFVKENNPLAQVKYVTSEKFANQFAEASIKKNIQLFANYYSKADVLIIEDVQFFATMPRTQEVFFQVFNHLHQNKKQIILTSDRAPKDLNGVQDRLLSRLKWGLIAEVKVPDFQTRISIIKNKIESNGIVIPDNVIEYIAFCVESNIREMEGIITSLIAHSTLMRKELDLDLAKEIVQTLVHDASNEISIEYIQNIVSEYFNVSVDDIKGKSRKQEIVLPRQISMYFAKESTTHSLKVIGGEFGGKDHTTVIHAIKTINDLMANDKKIEKYLEDIRKKLKISPLA